MRTRTIVALLALAFSPGFLGAVPLHVELMKEAAAAKAAGDAATALTKLQEAARLRPDYPRLRLDLARAYLAVNQPDDAIFALQDYVAMGLSYKFADDPTFASLRKHPRFHQISLRGSFTGGATARQEAVLLLYKIDGIIESPLQEPGTSRWYFSDVRNRCIWRRSADGTMEKFTHDEDALDGVFKLAWSPDHKTLWASTATVAAMKGPGAGDGERSALVAIDAATGRVRSRHPVPGDGAKHLLGDFIFTPDGSILATDSLSPVIWRLNPTTQNLERWMVHDDFLSLQGLTLSLDGRMLFVADYANGIWRIDRTTKSSLLLLAPRRSTFFGIDGLYMARDGLLAIQNGVVPQRVLRIKPAEFEGMPSDAEVLLADQPALVDAGLGTFTEGRFHFVSDSGWAHYDPAPTTPPEPRTVSIHSFAVE